MKSGDVIKTVILKKGTHLIELDRIYPIGDIKNAHLKRKLIGDDENTSTQYANKLEVVVDQDTHVSVHLGKGYVAVEAPEWTNKFIRHHGWNGGDGIFSFNIESGKDAFDQEKTPRTLLVFGDTFVGRSDVKTNKRLEPHLMINNSLAYIENDEISFHVNTQEDGSITGFFHLDPQFDYVGSTAQDLLDELAKKHFGYVSGYNPKDLTITFDFHISRPHTHVLIENYYNEQADELKKRGIKELSIYGSNDLVSFEKVIETTLKMSEKPQEFQKIALKGTYRYLQFRPHSNYNDQDFNEGLFGLSRIAFYHGEQHYKDIEANASSTLLKEREHSWIWLQDGAVVNDTLYFLPFIVNSDLDQPEGLQFRIVGLAQFSIKIKDGKLDFSTLTQKRAPLLRKKGLSEWLFGSGVMPNTKQAGALNPDGYIYVYGLKTTYGLRELIVSRVKAENYSFFDDYEFYNNGQWSKEILDATPVLQHVSSELSVSEIREGRNKGKFICVYTYDVNTDKVAFSIGETPWGPFTDPQIIYLTPEQAFFKSTTYTYNAKAHPHLSKSTEILITYNVNTYSFDHNMNEYRVYRPRFLKLIETE